MYGDTFLNNAVYQNRIDLVMTALRAKANPNVKNHFGLTSLMIANINDYPDMKHLLKGYGAKNEEVIKPYKGTDFNKDFADAVNNNNYVKARELALANPKGIYSYDHPKMF